MHLARSATGDHMSRWHLEAGIACEHAIAPSIQKTDWDRIAGFYQVLAWSPVVALNRALALAERDGLDEGRRELIALAGERKLSRYPFYWAARADLERRAGTTPRPGTAMSAPLPWPAARPSACPTSGGSRAWKFPRACPVPAPAIRRPPEDHPMRPGQTGARDVSGPREGPRPAVGR